VERAALEGLTRARAAPAVSKFAVPPGSILAPSDVARVPPGLAITVGGRVTEVHESSLILADALRSLRVDLSITSEIAPGDLAIVAGTSAAEGIAEGRVIERIVPHRRVRRAQPADDPAGEHDRLARGVGPALFARARALRAIRSLFEADGFLEVDTPAIVPSPGLDLHLDAFEVIGGRAPTYLITSPEYQMKRLLSGGVPRCFQLARCFRKGETGSLHNPEFLLLEWYRAFAGVESILDDTERIVRHVARELTGEEAIASPNAPNVRVDLSQPFERLSVGDAFARYAGVPADDAIALASTNESRFFELLVDAVEPALALSSVPIFLVDYPMPFASLARANPSDPRVSERFELYVGGVELCNGFGELTCPIEQRARLVRDQDERRARGLPEYPIDERFLAALEEGMPPAAGNALGVDRLIALCLGAGSIADVLPFPIAWI
jgi:lysyl-tRNA synthetase class 2